MIEYIQLTTQHHIDYDNDRLHLLFQHYIDYDNDRLHSTPQHYMSMILIDCIHYFSITWNLIMIDYIQLLSIT